MIFGKIDYINLLPFHVFLKRSSLPNAFKQAIEYKKGVPSTLNKKLQRGKIDAAVISSVTSDKKYYKKLNMGIVANKRVDSVLVRKNSTQKDDVASASSNALAKVLGAKGEVVIGDNALKLYLKNPDDFDDLCSLWYKKTSLPFVFARFCVRRDFHFYEGLAKKFVHQKIKIPRYILHQYSTSRGIDANDITQYLKLISYKLGKKEQQALKLFLKKSKNL